MRGVERKKGFYLLVQTLVFVIISDCRDAFTVLFLCSSTSAVPGDLFVFFIWIVEDSSVDSAEELHHKTRHFPNLTFSLIPIKDKEIKTFSLF